MSQLDSPKENSDLEHGLEQIPEEVKSFLEGLSEEKKKEFNALISVSKTHVSASSFRGPLPPPEILSKYDRTVKDGAERVFAMAENQSSHRMQLENHAIREELKQSGRGQVFGFILGGIGLLCATLLAAFDHETIAGIFGTTTIGALVTVFVIGKKQQRD